MPAFVEKHGITYPVAIDSSGATHDAFAVDSHPDYYVIDRAGKLRVADLANAELERVIEDLLAEPAPASVPAPLADVAATARKKDTRVLAVMGSAEHHGSYRRIVGSDRDLAKLQLDEYQVAFLDAAEHAGLAARVAPDASGATLVAFSAEGDVLGWTLLHGLDAAGVAEFLRAHQLPQKDAKVLWAGALEEAKRGKKRVLVHLGAPW